MAAQKASLARTGCGCVVALLLLGLVAGMLLPAKGRARRISPVTRCIVDLKSIGLAMLLYREDNSDYLPPNIVPALRPYLGDKGSASCTEHKEDYVYLFRRRLVRLQDLGVPSERVCAHCPRLHTGEAENGGAKWIGYNFLFLDGHVEHIPERGLSTVVRRTRRALRQNRNSSP